MFPSTDIGELDCVALYIVGHETQPSCSIILFGYRSVGLYIYLQGSNLII